LLNGSLGAMLVVFHITKFNKCSPIMSYFCSSSNIVKRDEGGIDEELLADHRVKCFEPHIVRSIGGGDGVRVRVSMKGTTIDPLRGVGAALEHRDTINLDISYIPTELLLAKLVSVMDRVVVGLE